MTPAARISAAIDILDRIIEGGAAEQALTGWARASRYAGSGDRVAVRDLVFAALRCLRSHTALAGAMAPSGRALMIGAGFAPLFTGEGHAPLPLTDAELAARTLAPSLDRLPEAVQADCPDWLVAPLRDSLGEDFLPVMQTQRQRAPVWVRVNLARITRDQAQVLLAAEGVETERSDLASSALMVHGKSNKINKSGLYLDGRIELQDLSSQAAVEALPLRDGMTVLDYCAGGGGKLLAMAARVQADFTAHDAAPERMRDLAPRAARAGVRAQLIETAALAGRQFDLVLVDAPCSGSGTWRRTPDAKWRLTAERLDALCALQARILDEAAPLVRAGGRLVYMTCSVLRAENAAQEQAFCQRAPHFLAQSRRSFLPIEGGDGFFVTQFERL
ncbi:MAG: RsmB/NOP family class I SAM-dependent RNA methyltransferase [Rhodobacteraceae bacterium]|nr:RsmB/NOP family class I SAM-dependent RNA methyltransferase [Paracoccaceae bacterium]